MKALLVFIANILSVAAFVIIAVTVCMAVTLFPKRFF
jgi:hypothetical protein